MRVRKFDILTKDFMRDFLPNVNRAIFTLFQFISNIVFIVKTPYLVEMHLSGIYYHSKFQLLTKRQSHKSLPNIKITIFTIFSHT